jgi:hypothetical protein
MSISGNAPVANFPYCLRVQKGSFRYRLISSVARGFPRLVENMIPKHFPILDFQIAN